eukprot:CAMPEP_0178392620 /NCGR_PEP_ID=MMETSP0689_2-20121128/11771_1 /TAXON_ID=160604 /ORGANISM="Amphidinium massartii, Strain CS-259" /LENGTH=372 /DNA_ID=CAMNT_0020013197 /DNA_START=53 /DNA_END=1171 /DNA_ORIENTATION=+
MIFVLLVASVSTCAASVSTCAARGVVPICSSSELPGLGHAKGFRVHVPTSSDGKEGPVLDVAVVRSRTGEVFVLEDSLPPLHQKISGPGCTFDGNVYTATCRGLGTRFDVRSGALMGPWCSGPPFSTKRVMPVRSLLLFLLALGLRFFSRPRTLRVLPHLVQDDMLYLRQEDCPLQAAGGSSALGFLRHFCLPKQALTIPEKISGARFHVWRRRQRDAARRVTQMVEIRLTLRLPLIDRLRYCSPFAPEVGSAFLRLPDTSNGQPEMVALVKKSVENPPAEPRIAVWVSQYVEPYARGRGVDKMILQKVMEIAHAAGFDFLLFMVDDRGETAYPRLRRYYEKQGCIAVPKDNMLGIANGMLWPVKLQQQSCL